MVPAALWAVVATTMASVETKHTYDGEITPGTFRTRFARIVPYLVINTGMLPHQFASFAEGLFGPMHSEFERTPKVASVTTPAVARPARPPTRPDTVKVHWPYLLTEAFFVVYQLGWAVPFALNGLVVCTIGAAYVASCIVYLGLFYGDHLGKVCFVLDPGRLRWRNPLAGGGPSSAGSDRRSPREPAAHATDRLDHVPAQLAAQATDGIVRMLREPAPVAVELPTTTARAGAAVEPEDVRVG